MNKSYIIKELYENIQENIDNQGKEIEGIQNKEFNEIYSSETIEILNEASKILKIAEIYSNRLYKFFGGDDGEESLKNRLREDLIKLEISEKENRFK
jgi:hypothetical protein